MGEGEGGVSDTKDKKLFGVFLCLHASESNLCSFPVIVGISLSSVFPFEGHGESSDLRDTL